MCLRFGAFLDSGRKRTETPPRFASAHSLGRGSIEGRLCNNGDKHVTIFADRVQRFANRCTNERNRDICRAKTCRVIVARFFRSQRKMFAFVIGKVVKK